MTYFVDCDDTLVLWGSALEEIIGGDKWSPNDALVNALEDIPEHEIIIWSGGGLQYARMWRDRILPRVATCASKDTRIPLPGDICIDDMPLKVAARVVTWQQFVSERPDPAAAMAGIARAIERGDE